jgi:hypothetical protein
MVGKRSVFNCSRISQDLQVLFCCSLEIEGKLLKIEYMTGKLNRLMDVMLEY